MNHKILSIPIPSRARRIRGSRTSWVDWFEHDGRGFYLKTYVYPPPFGPLRGIFRNTFLARSRAEREWIALDHLSRHGLQPALQVEIRDRRRFGFLIESQLLTHDFGGTDLEQRLAPGGRGLDRAAWEALAGFVLELHASGLRDPDLVARNLLVRDGPCGVEFAKIDASSSHLGRPGGRFDKRRAADLVRFARDLARLGARPRRILALCAWQWFPDRRPAAAAAAWRSARRDQERDRTVGEELD